MTGRGARWVFVTVSLPTRSKEQRMHAAAFKLLLPELLTRILSGMKSPDQDPLTERTLSDLLTPGKGDESDGCNDEEPCRD